MTIIRGHQSRHQQAVCFPVINTSYPYSSSPLESSSFSCRKHIAPLFRFQQSIRRFTLRASKTIVAYEAENGLPQLPPRPAGPHLSPSYWLTREESVEAQLHALQRNNSPYPDHGVEVLYRFAGIDPWHRSAYFGRSLDLGQFERFRRILYTKCYVALLGHTKSSIQSEFQVSEDVWKARVLVINDYRKEERVYQFTMKRRVGGKYDGFWYCTELVCDDENCDDKSVYGVI